MFRQLAALSPLQMRVSAKRRPQTDSDEGVKVFVRIQQGEGEGWKIWVIFVIWCNPIS